MNFNCQKMKKRFIVITAAQTIVILLLFVFAFVQKTEVDRQRQVAETNAMQAQEQRIIAEHLRARLEAETNKLKAELARLQSK